MFLLCSLVAVLDPLPIGERHGFCMQRLTELCGKHVELASQRTLRAADDDEMDRRALVFDRLARGFRMTIILEARLDRERRWADRESPANDAVPHLRVAASNPRPKVERERERETETETETEFESDDEGFGDAVLRRMDDLEDCLADDDFEVDATVVTDGSGSATAVPHATTPHATTPRAAAPPIVPPSRHAHNQRRWAGSG